MFAHLPNYQKANPLLWQGRDDTPNERFFQNIQFITKQNQLNTEEKKILFIGFASDAGIVRNMGRPGAKLGPDELKIQLAKLPCFSSPPLIDLGTVVCEGDALESAQNQFAELIHFCHQFGHKTIALGGGHEIAWGHFKGLSPHYPKLGIINFDAHFDLRPYEQGKLGNSGTPFSQIATECKEKNVPFNYCCLGIQNLGNTPSLFQRAKKLNVSFLTAEKLYEQNFSLHTAFLDDFIQKVDHLYLTICLDVLAECFAPGVSAPQALGLTPWQVLPLLKYIVQSGKVVSIDIAELSPPFDQGKKTARLAALIIAELLNIY
jgi:formiminoglutamase